MSCERLSLPKPFLQAFGIEAPIVKQVCDEIHPNAYSILVADLRVTTEECVERPRHGERAVRFQLPQRASDVNTRHPRPCLLEDDVPHGHGKREPLLHHESLPRLIESAQKAIDLKV